MERSWCSHPCHQSPAHVTCYTRHVRAGSSPASGPPLTDYWLPSHCGPARPPVRHLLGSYQHVPLSACVCLLCASSAARNAHFKSRVQWVIRCRWRRGQCQNIFSLHLNLILAIYRHQASSSDAFLRGCGAHKIINLPLSISDFSDTDLYKSN